ncbi:hypothetical protein CBL_20466 [Carabus blaptoides fortunei]
MEDTLKEILERKNDLQEGTNRLNEAAKIQGNRIEGLEREIRKRKVVIQGIEEAKNEDEDRIKNKVNEVLSKMQIKIDLKCDITELRRIGRERQKNKLKRTEIYINGDFPKEIQNQRRELIKYMKTARAQGHEVTLLYNKLKINDEIYTLEQLEEYVEVVGEALTDHENESKTNTSKRTPGKMQEIVDEIKRYRVDIVAIQETRWKGQGEIRKSDFMLKYSGAEKQGQHGVGFIIMGKMKDKII